MSRRCDREGVAWHREAPRHAVLCAAGESDMLWEVHHLRWVYGVDHIPELHQRVMRHMRLRPVLPPWATVAGERGSRG